MIGSTTETATPRRPRMTWGEPIACQTTSSQLAEPKAVEHHDHAGQPHGHRRHQRIEEAEGGQREGGQVVAHGPAEVLDDHRVGRPGHPDRGRVRPGGRCPTGRRHCWPTAASEPLPMAHPTSAAAKAGASLTPSPTITTDRECIAAVCVDAPTLPAGAQSARGVVDVQLPGDRAHGRFAVTAEDRGGQARGSGDGQPPVWPRHAAGWSRRWRR